MASSDKRLYVNGYDELKNTLKQIGKDKRIFVFFFDSKNEKRHNWYRINAQICSIYCHLI